MPGSTRGRQAAAQRAQQSSGNTPATTNGGGNVPDRQPQGDSLRALFERQRGEIERALPAHMDADRLLRVALTVVKNDEKLSKANPMSLLGALMTCSQVGLEPGPQGHAYFVPFWDRHSSSFQVTFILGYQGMIELARRSGLLMSIAAHTVYENELAGKHGGHFAVKYGTENTLEHTPIVFGDRGKPVGYYATARIKSPSSDATEDVFVVLTREDVEQFRARSATQKADKPTGPWNTDYESMAWKGLALDTPIPTPTGWATMGDLTAHDIVFDMNGEPTRVVAVSEVKHLDCYRLTFTNGDTIVCDAEHEWVAGVGHNAARNGFRKRNIAELYAAKREGKPVTVPQAGILNTVKYGQPSVTRDAWLLGFWLGDGAARDARLTVHRDNVHHVAEQITKAGYTVGAILPDPRSNAVAIGVRSGFRKRLADLGMLGYKHVPGAFLRGDPAERLAILQGLMDSDGTMTRGRGRAVFSSTSQALAGNVAELVASLGDTPTQVTVMRSGFGKRVASHEVQWQPTLCPVSLPAKVSRFRPRKLAAYRSVRSIEKVPTVPTVCIGVDSETHTFLAGRSMVPTHNTCIRRLSRWLPQSPELAASMSHEGTVRRDVAANVVDQQQPAPAEPFTVDHAQAAGELEAAPPGDDDMGANPETGELPPEHDDDDPENGRAFTGRPGPSDDDDPGPDPWATS